MSSLLACGAVADAAGMGGFFLVPGNAEISPWR